jgi:glycosyltransferase involved in cell wall biosynthesis
MIKENNMHKVKLLILGAGRAMPNSPTAYWDKYEWLSKYFTGAIIASVGDRKHLVTEKTVDGFSFYPFLNDHESSLIRNIVSLFTIITKALKIYYSGEKYEVIISPNPLLTGLTGIIIRLFTKAKVVIEVNGDFGQAFKYGLGAKMRLSEKIKEKISKIIVPFVLRKADMIKLLYAHQIDSLKKRSIERIPCVTIPEFVLTNRFQSAELSDQKYVLLLGYPWYLKGVDVLIQAFKKISNEFPEYRLKIVGWCPEGRRYFEDLAKGNDKIELCDPVYYEEVFKLMSACSLYVLASRSEAMGRVLVEAMACRKPIIASNVGGVPSIIKHEYNGLLFESENIDDLANKMRIVLGDKEFAYRLGENGYKFAQENLSEQCYIDKYKDEIGRAHV